jgi:hypothetical protein
VVAVPHPRRTRRTAAVPPEHARSVLRSQRAGRRTSELPPPVAIPGTRHRPPRRTAAALARTCTAVRRFSLHAGGRSSRPAHVVAVIRRRTSPGAPARRNVRSTAESPWARGRSNSTSGCLLASGCCVVVWWSACPPVAHSYPSSQSRPTGGIFHPWRVTSRQPAHNPPAARRPTGSSGGRTGVGRTARARRRRVVVLRCSGGVWFLWTGTTGGLDGVLAGVGGAGAGGCERGGDAVGAGREWAVLLPAGSRAISGCACRGVFGRAHRRDGYGRWGRSGVDGVGYACGLQAGDG